jgi:hypothetical protein
VACGVQLLFHWQVVVLAGGFGETKDISEYLKTGPPLLFTIAEPSHAVACGCDL